MNPDFWNEKFSTAPNLYGLEPNSYFKEKINQLQPGRLLLPGEGEGRNALYAATCGWSVDAVDQSEIAKNTALSLAIKSGLSINYHVCDIQKFIPEVASYDTLALIYFHLPKEIIETAYTKLAKSLQMGGKLIVEGFGKNQLRYRSGGPKNIDMLYELKTLKSILPNFDWEEEYDGIIELNEGIGHVGEAHVIRLLGTKIN
ncbi:class I SAM-dependent methyltransferase [Mongoliitalea daihaiensis]|uniref:class I SAM-dependent methyltransferase n=1 Tax=Mongoliitalea daihaiensis TaxID=2782006 RepID=UPI001F453B9A|nr:class I SAM-dependent methyltransferase [Mongoliitalea daihaiensis]UJP64581.1 class I SAM-dependent methyltransferase [Mongoliitalea daihaiensis]